MTRTKRCRHDAGWFTPEAVHLLARGGTLRILVKWSAVRRVRMQCNVPDCGATRLVYVGANGALFKFGPVRSRAKA